MIRTTDYNLVEMAYLKLELPMTLSPDARRQHIMQWLVEAKSLSIEALVTRLGVSAMTVHRDLDLLAKDSLVQKSYGYVTLVERAEPLPTSSVCAMCRSEVQFRTATTLQFQDGTLAQACCAHCGLLLAQHQPEIVALLTRDFVYGQMVNAFTAVYVYESRVRLCCMPSLLAFSCRDDAESFVKGFGGVALTYSEAQTLLSQHHHPNHHR
ncbi:MAG: DeoR family transcriptional regulator [Anaerolinea sp.]|nr:DeoR family transcriptional regulator [Anaerolinea sp.]